MFHGTPMPVLPAVVRCMTRHRGESCGDTTRPHRHKQVGKVLVVHNEPNLGEGKDRRVFCPYLCLPEGVNGDAT